ncbi:hypothetical protein [Streptomyces lanatus]|uniref:Uncharacterized protein n=1 Tax=Streptomyces lanatus TaxID=66900 RepID=A0ABV1XTN0_9ACTN|nr:hypothetical protein [Streptomyces lanatus]GHH09078.1 hypothetical protein GCM10018780_44470 [Streptomyces lanatus]
MFAREQIKLLAESGWNTCDSVREGVKRAGLPLPTPAYLKRAIDTARWNRAERAVAALRDHFKDARFADEAVYGVLLVPDPDKLDTRGAVDPAMRADQTGGTAKDVVDGALPAGRLVVPPGADWTPIATVTGPAGLHFGSFDDITQADVATFTVDGVDTRDLMVRQIWGARVLQSGSELPDCEVGGGWTFTLFPGEPQVDGKAVSGTVLHDKVRFRLGRSDRGIAVVRVCPALVVG